MGRAARLGLLTSLGLGCWLCGGVSASAAGTGPAPGAMLKSGDKDSCALQDWLTCTTRAMPRRFARAAEVRVRAHRDLVMACDGGFAAACSEVGRDLAEGVGTAKDVAAGMKLMRSTCNATQALCNNLGVAYYFGWSVPRDLAEAARLYQRGCGAGEQAACTNWATMVLDHEAPGEPQVALGRLETACQKSLAEACHNLGFHYHLPRDGSAPDYAKARRYYEIACAWAKADSCNNLGTIYEAGSGVPQDFATAARLYTFGCDYNVGSSCHRLAILHDSGAGVPKDRAKARKLLEMACESKDAKACALVGRPPP